MQITNLATHPKAFVTVAELVEYTEIPRRTMYHHIEKGTLQAVKMGGSLKIPIEEARRFASVPAHPEYTVASGTTAGGSQLFCATSS